MDALQESDFHPLNTLHPIPPKCLSMINIIPHTLPRQTDNKRSLVNNSALGISTLSGHRRIHEDGVRMLHNNLVLKETQLKANVLANRLLKLE